jgi:hypothetical protein
MRLEAMTASRTYVFFMWTPLELRRRSAGSAEMRRSNALRWGARVTRLATLPSLSSHPRSKGARLCSAQQIPAAIGGEPCRTDRSTRKTQDAT